MNRVVEGALAFLVSADMIVEVGEHLGSTEFGTLALPVILIAKCSVIVMH